VWGDLSEPDGGFHRFHLAEEGPDVAELVLSPVLQQAGCLGRDLPLMGLRQTAPLVHLLPHGVDHGCRLFILLGRCGQPFAFVENKLLLGVGSCALPGAGNGCDKLGAAAAVENPLGGLTLLIQLPMPRRVGIG